jgi:KaiC/GvpD/RAD55 family RecA-like ATPase
LSLSGDIVGRMRDLPESSAIAMLIKIDDYLDTMRATLDTFSVEKDLADIYITSTIPSQSIKNVLQILEINMERIYFVDCISHIMMGTAVRSEHVHVSFVESPTMLENIMLKVEYLMRSVQGNKLVLLDSINSLAIHNNTKILSEFLHILVNNLRAKNAYTIILSVDEQSNEEINNMLGLVCDETLNLVDKK